MPPPQNPNLTERVIRLPSKGKSPRKRQVHLAFIVHGGNLKERKIMKGLDSLFAGVRDIPGM